MRKSNTFRKAIKHLKSSQIDERLEMLNEIPTNNTTGIYIVQPDYQVQDPDIPGPTRQADFTQDALGNGRDTSGLFLEDGTILTIEPPDELGNKSFILGPMASMWYAWGNFTTIGYIRQSDRRMVDLGRITGQLGNWDGVSNFTSYGQLNVEQARWFRDTPKLNGADNNSPNYRAFYPGPPSNHPDHLGRYLAVITGTSKPTSVTPPPRRVPPTLGGFDPNIPMGSANPNRKKDYEIADTSRVKELDRKYLEKMLKYGQYKIPGRPGGYIAPGEFEREFGKPGLSQQGKDGYEIAGYGLRPDGTMGLNKVGDKSKGNDGKEYELVPRPGYGYNQWVPVKQAGVDSDTQIAKNKKNSKTQVAHYNPSGQVLTESRKRILKEIKKPYVLPEVPKEKYQFIPKVNRTINSDLMKQAEVPSSFKKPEERMWGKYEREQNARMSQERKNEVLDHLGGSDHFWEFVTETIRKEKTDGMYKNFGVEKGKAKLVRKEELKGDVLLFISDEDGNKDSILQSELSIRIADEFNKELFEKYFEEQETLDAKKEPLFKKVSKKLKKEIDYLDKPAKNGYPNDPPPEMINGRHPKFGEKSDYYNKLDQQSASSMPSTGNPKIDNKVAKAKNKLK